MPQEIDGRPSMASSPEQAFGTLGRVASSVVQQTPEAPVDASPRPDVALLIDWANLKWSLSNAHGVEPSISSVLEAAREKGRVVAARAYGDWTQRVLALDAGNLHRQGIDPVFTPSRYGKEGRLLKNSADVRLAVDAVDLCRQLPHVTTYVVVTGDGDLVHATNYLRLNGRRVVVIGVRGTISAGLNASADELCESHRPPDDLIVPPFDLTVLTIRKASRPRL